jgi:vancomycin permeability regulator SanA
MPREPERRVVAVLGLALGPGGEPSALLRERCALAAGLLEGERAGATVILSGGDPAGWGVTEARAMAGLLGELGVAGERVLLEEEARNTFDNAVYVLRLAEGLGAREVVVVTSHFHLPRSTWLFRVVAKAMGLAVVVEGRGAGGEGAAARVQLVKEVLRRVLLCRCIVTAKVRMLEAGDYTKTVVCRLRRVGLEPERMEEPGRPLGELRRLLGRGPE